MAKGATIDKFYFHSKGLKLVLEETDENELYDEMVGEIEEEIQKTEMAEGSGWTFAYLRYIKRRICSCNRVIFFILIIINRVIHWDIFGYL